MKTHFAIRDKTTGKLLTHTLRSNGDATECSDISVVLSKHDYNAVWVTTDRHEAEGGIVATNDWWLEVRNPLGQKGLEVVEVTIEVKEGE